jgi:hypothetical protein
MNYCIHCFTDYIGIISQTPGPVEQQLLRQVADIIRRCEDELSISFVFSGTNVSQLMDRRISDTSTASTISTHTHATPMPASTTGLTSPSAVARIPFLLPQSPAQTRNMPEQPIQFRTVPWDMPPSQTPSSDWIDWCTIFPVPPHMQLPDSTCDEPNDGNYVPMWTGTGTQWT